MDRMLWCIEMPLPCVLRLVRPLEEKEAIVGPDLLQQLLQLLTGVQTGRTIGHQGRGDPLEGAPVTLQVGCADCIPHQRLHCTTKCY